MNTLQHIINKYKINRNIIEISDVNRMSLAKLLNELDFKVGVEIGVASGEYLSVLCKANPQMKFSGIDMWTPYKGYNDYTKQSTFDTLEKDAIERMKPFFNYKFIKEWSMDAVKKFEDNSLDFCYIDSNHRDPYVTEDIREWSKKVRSGGIVAGHDYVEADYIDVVNAITKYTKDNNINPLFVIGLEAKIPGLIRDNTRSWMFIKS